MEVPVPDDIVPHVRETGKVPKYAHAGLTSHVLLAACRPSEVAREKDGNGLFTRALLRELEANDVTKISYVDLIRQVGRVSE